MRTRRVFTSAFAALAVGLATVASNLPTVAHAEDPPAYHLKWGTLGAGDGQFQIFGPSGLEVGPYGEVFAVDYNNHRVQVFGATGDFLRKWGSFGSGDGQFLTPFDVAVNWDTHTAYVADLGNARVQKFTTGGVFLGQWGSSGSGQGQFASPNGVAVGPDGSVYVADRQLARIQKFDADGGFLLEWGSSGQGDGQFLQVIGIAADPSGNVYVAEYGNSRVQKFDANGDFLAKWDAQGAGDGEFSFVGGVGTDAAGNVFVVDWGNDRIQKFDGDGTFLTKWGESGLSDGQFLSISAVAIAPSGYVYVSDNERRNIQMFVPGTVDVTPAAGPAAGFVVHGGRPNPLTDRGVVAYELPAAARVTAAVYDASGRLVRRLSHQQMRPAGRHELQWDGRDESEGRVGSGVYFVVVRTPEHSGLARFVITQ